MDWATIANLILTIGLPAAEKLWTLVTTNTAPTAADWATLKTLGAVNAKDVMTAQLKAAGIPLTDPKAIALLAQVS